MARYIDAELFEQDIKMRYCNNCENPNPNRYNAYEIKCRCCHIDDMLGEIEDAPTADVKEVKYGKWVHTVEYGNIGKYHYWNCSLCGVSSIDEGREKFCHECGADMRGEEDGKKVY